MSYIGSKPANKPVVASDLDPTVITGQTALAVAPADTDEFLISDAGVLKRLDASLIGGTNTPAFRVYRSSNQSMGNGYQKIQHNAEDFDTDNAFDSSTNYRFTVPSGKAGKYFFNAQHKLNSMPNGGRISAAIYVNGSIKAQNIIAVGIAEDNSSNVSAILDLSVGNYVEMYGYHNANSSLNASGSSSDCFFQGYKLIT